jgi:hypothetical protein
VNSTTVLGLQRLREYPSVSILVPVEPGPQLTEVDRLRIQRRIDDLARRLLGDVDAPTTVEVMERLQGLLTELTDQPVGRSVALFASPSTSISHQLHVEVRERTVVDDTFATRDLLDEARRTVAFVAATVSDRMVQAVEAQGDVIAPVKGRGVPLERLPDETDACWERRTVALLRRLGSGPLPLVLFGAGRRVATLVRSGGVEPAAVILGNHDRTPWATLADLARGPLADWAGARNATALHRLDQARGRRRYASGLDEIWSLAGESRVELLVVERNFAVPVRADGAHLVPVDADQIEAPDVVDDAVDDLIEAVALRRGEVVIVPDGVLADQGRVAAVLRF